jgi:hypothetical protein
VKGIELRSKVGGFFRRKAVWPVLCAGLLLAGAWWTYARQELPRNETRFTFARIQFRSPMSFGRRGGFGGRNGAPWSHDFPKSEENLMKILGEVTKIDVNPGGHIVSFENEDCFQYPVAYLCEVGFLNLSEKEAHNMREYLLRGGFLIVDDFRGAREFDNFIYQLKAVFPERALEELPRSHPIFTCFYDISDLSLEPPYSRFNRPEYWGMKDDRGRLMMVIDYNNDISDYWEWSADPFYDFQDTNEGFKYGVNYILYALTH